MMNTKLLEVVTPQSIYHSCSTWETFWEEKFTGGEKFTLGELSPVNRKNCGSRNVRKHREIKVSYKYVNMDILLKFGSMDKMRITSSEPKYNFGKIGKEVDCLSGSQGQKQGQINIKRQGMPSEMSVGRTFKGLSGSLRSHLIKFMKGKGPNMSPLEVTFT